MFSPNWILTRVSVLDFYQEQLKVHARGEHYEAGRAVGDWNAWIRKDDGEKLQQKENHKYKQENKTEWTKKQTKEQVEDWDAWVWKDDGEHLFRLSSYLKCWHFARFEGNQIFVMQGVFLEHGDCFSSCMKIGEKTINVKGKVTNLGERNKTRVRTLHTTSVSLPPSTQVLNIPNDLPLSVQRHCNLPPGDWGLHCGGVWGWRKHRLPDEADSCPSVDQRQPSCTTFSYQTNSLHQLMFYNLQLWHISINSIMSAGP